MAHIVIITSHMAGRINATCELSRRLDAAGHTVTLASPVDIGERVAAQGMDFLYIGSPGKKPRVTESHKPGIVRRITRLVRRFGSVRTIGVRREAAVAALDLDRMTETMQQLAPDLYLIDIELPVEIMVASATGVPVGLWTTMLSLWKRPGVPPLHTNIVPGDGWRGTRAGIEWAWLRFRVWKWVRYQRLRVTRVGTDQMSVLRRVARRTGFPLRNAAAPYHWLIPFVYRSLPTLMFNVSEIEFPHEPDPVCIYVGPLLNADRRIADADDAQVAITRRLDAIYERRHTGQTKTLIYCSFGAWHGGDDLDFFRRVVNAVERQPDWELVMGLGARVDPESFEDIPANVHLFAWAPQMEVLRHADVAIHHAGISTINESVVSGVPMVVYPYDYGDTAGAAARVAFHRIGLRGDRVADTVDDIYDAIRRVTSDPGYRTRMEELRNRYAEYEAGEAAVRAVQRLLDGDPVAR